jgi:hypothetical protein
MNVARSPVAPNARTTKPLQFSNVKAGIATVKPPRDPVLVHFVDEWPGVVATTRTCSVAANPTPRTVNVARSSIITRGVVADASAGVKTAAQTAMNRRIRTLYLCHLPCRSKPLSVPT